jgi:hypothetical protein
MARSPDGRFDSGMVIYLSAVVRRPNEFGNSPATNQAEALNLSRVVFVK